jgi:gamma-glutamyl:cysteine ligase YbdK (ATP-grasp superfamily)
MRHWHTVGLDIPRQVARLQSLTPLLQARIHSTLADSETQPSNNGQEVTRARFDRNKVKIESGTQVASRGPTWRMATPLA